VDHPGRVGRLQGPGHLQGDADRPRRLEPPLLVQDLGEGPPGQVLHDHVQGAVGSLAEVGQVDDVLVVDPADGLRFPTEALDRVGGGWQVVSQQLEREHPPEHLVPGDIDRGHPAGPEEGEDAVAVADDLADPGVLRVGALGDQPGDPRSRRRRRRRRRPARQPLHGLLAVLRAQPPFGLQPVAIDRAEDLAAGIAPAAGGAPIAGRAHPSLLR